MIPGGPSCRNISEVSYIQVLSSVYYSTDAFLLGQIGIRPFSLSVSSDNGIPIPSEYFTLQPASISSYVTFAIIMTLDTVGIVITLLAVMFVSLYMHQFHTTFALCPVLPLRLKV